MRFYFQELQGNLGSETEGCSANFIYTLLKNVFRRRTCPLFIAGLSAQEKYPEASPTRGLVQTPRSKQAPAHRAHGRVECRRLWRAASFLVPLREAGAGVWSRGNLWHWPLLFAFLQSL